MKILVVEDDPSSKLFLKSLLEISSYDVRAAENGIEGLNIFEEYLPDIVITDIQMPRMDGLELLGNIKQRKPETIVIITTAFGTETYAIQALHLGASNYLKKPVRKEDLLPLLEKYDRILMQDFNPFGDRQCGKIIERTVKLEFQASIKNIPMIVDRLLSEASCSYSNDVKVNIELGLVELITNAVEHGTYNISYKTKKEALDNYKIEKLYADRAKDPKYKGKKIFINYRFDAISCEWIIRDEGEGFDWKALPDPTTDENLQELSGRGIFITRFLFDELEYIGKGNIVRAKKYLNQEVAEIKAEPFTKA